MEIRTSPSLFQDILFWYPDSEKSKILRNTRGIFLTLSDMLSDVMAEQIQRLVTYSFKSSKDFKKLYRYHC